MAVIAIQLAYYTIDFFNLYPLRAGHAALVLAASVGLAAAIGGFGSRIPLGPIAMAGVFGLAAMQFTTFYVDYFTEFSARGSAEVEGNVRGAFERVIQRARGGAIPAIYLGRIGPYAHGGLYWKFYLVRQAATDLEARTIVDGDFRPDRIRALPRGSVVITSPTRDIDRQINDMVAAGDFTRQERLEAPDGAPIFWILDVR